MKCYEIWAIGIDVQTYIGSVGSKYEAKCITDMLRSGNKARGDTKSWYGINENGDVKPDSFFYIGPERFKPTSFDQKESDQYEEWFEKLNEQRKSVNRGE